MNVKKRPIRTCIACRSSDDKKELLRIVRSADGTIEIDPTGKKPGRGAYVCRSTECVAAAVKRKGFERALRTAVPVELIDQLKKAVQENENADR
ncbi:MAG TPA: YlxR family protein [Armatimonadota bacterium]|jgi:predicted RNA-binding protein YlxR (DUF448 family)|nr:YlxR family protein [Armatimonadota bacterium]HOM71266.1 YlxR family protein [Armatimonadota bacterium]HOP80089.1 YlxR family protein [Armatimonadota bacterium]HPP74521.1 YlxR family protein [Armatimonadota bacterium]